MGENLFIYLFFYQIYKLILMLYIKKSSYRK